jgi:hypothetical protein
VEKSLEELQGKYANLEAENRELLNEKQEILKSKDEILGRLMGGQGALGHARENGAVVGQARSEILEGSTRGQRGVGSENVEGAKKVGFFAKLFLTPTEGDKLAG